MRIVFRIVGVALFALMGAFFIAFGVLYASVDEMLPFHAAAVDEKHRAGALSLYIALMTLIGGASISLGGLGLFITIRDISRGRIVPSVAVSAAYAVSLLFAARTAVVLAEKTGAPTSWHIMGGLLFATVSALILVVISRKR